MASEVRKGPDRYNAGSDQCTGLLSNRKQSELRMFKSMYTLSIVFLMFVSCFVAPANCPAATTWSAMKATASCASMTAMGRLFGVTRSTLPADLDHPGMDLRATAPKYSGRCAFQMAIP